MSEDTAPRIVFVLCTERSGSTLLSAVLGSHSRVFAPTEMHMLRFPSVAEWRKGYPPAGASLDSLVRMIGVELPHALEAMAPVDLYRYLLSHCPPNSVVVDKTPAYARDPEILRIAEGFKPLYLWLIRHPVPVAMSRVGRGALARRARNRGLLPRLKYPMFLLRELVGRWTGRSFRERVHDWVSMQRNIRAHLERVEPDRWRVVHYEQLVREPRATVESLCQFLRLEFEPAMLDPQRSAPSGIGYGIGDEKFLQYSGITPELADAWRSEHDDSLLDPATREFARSLGVDVSSP